jgi:GT2 family glycosyltransferase
MRSDPLILCRGVPGFSAGALHAVAGFDGRFWMHAEEAEVAEEADLQQRLRARGCVVIFASDATVTHIGARSVRDSWLRFSLLYTGKVNSLREHRGPIVSPVARLAVLMGSVLRHRWRTAWIAISLRNRP